MSTTALTKMKKDLATMSGEIERALPQHLSPERFARIVHTAVSRTPKLLECERGSFFSSVLLSAQLGMEPNSPSGQCYLIPYGKQVQFQLGYRGLLELVRRSGELVSIHAELAYENDEFEIELGLEPRIKHIPKLDGDRGKIIAGYSVAKLKDGTLDFIWMSNQELQKIKEESKQNGKLGPAWKAWESEMFKKSVLKRHCKTLPMSDEIRDRVNTDDTFKQKIRTDMVSVDEGESADEVMGQSMATEEHKKAFYEDLDKHNCRYRLSDQDATRVQGEITKEELSEIFLTCKKLSENDNAKETEPSEDF